MAPPASSGAAAGFIPYGRQDIVEEDIAAVAAVLRSDWLTQGPTVEQFELALARHCGAAHAVAVNSATSALHVAYLALGVGPGDRVWTSPNTFVATANMAQLCGATVDFVDVDPRSYNMDMAALEAKLEEAARHGALPKLVVPVQFAGQSCDMQALGRLRERYGFKVVEDASHAVGASYRGEPVGACRYSDITVFSFHPVKIVTTAEGGMAVTQDERLAHAMRLARSHGTTREPAEMTGPSEGAWYYQQVALGLNYRLTDLQAALGLSQVRRLDAYVTRRHALARRYDELLAGLPLVLPWQDPAGRSALHLYPVQVDEARAGVSRRVVFDRLRAAGIGVNVHYIPVHTQPYWQRQGFRPGQFPQAERYYARALSLPLYAALTEAQQDRVVAALRECLA